MISRRFQVLDAALELAGPEDVIGPILHAYSRFAAGAPGSLPALRVALPSAGAPAVEVGSRQVPLVPDWDPTLQVYQLFLAAAMDGIGTHAVLHAAALERGGEAFLLAAPASHGKTSLTLELASRGYRFLSDDYAPLDLARGTIAPYPRTVGIVVREQAPLPEPFRRAALDPAAVRLAGKSLVDVGRVLGEGALVREPLPLRHVVLLTAGEPGTGPPEQASWLALACRSEGVEALDAALARTAGVEVRERRAHSHVTHYALRLDHRSYPTSELMGLIESPAIVYCEKRWDARPQFAGPPLAAAVPRRVAAEYLGREILNRRTGGRLMAGYGERLTELFLDLAGRLRDVDCWSVRAGPCGATADLIETLIGGGAASRLAGR